MSRKTNRRQLSPTKLRSSTDQKRTHLNSEIQKIINHAAKIITEYNKNSLEKLIDEDMDNLTKINRLVRASEQTWEKVHIPVKRRKSKRKHKRKRSTSLNQSSAFENDMHEMNIKVKSKWPTYLDEENSHKDEDSQNTNNVRHEYSSTFTETHQSRRLSKNELQEESIEINKSRTNSGTISKISIEKSPSCSVCSYKSGRESTGKNISQKDIKFQYGIEMKTSETEKFENYKYILIQLNGESNSMLDYRELSKLLEKSSESEIIQSDGIIKFTFGLNKYLGSILNINVQLDTEFEDFSWYLDYISVKDCLSRKIYFFSCRRWLGINSPDKLSQVTLTYTPPFKKENMSLSKSTTENVEMDKSEEFIIKEKIHSLSRSATDKSESSPVLSQRSNSDDTKRLEYQPTDNSIFEVIQAYDLSSLKQLCRAQIHIVRDFNENGFNPLHMATICFQDDDISREIFDYLISLNVDINSKSQDGLTCLQVAIVNGNLPAVKYLIENHKSDLTFDNQERNTSLQLSGKEEYQAIAEYLKEQNILPSFLRSTDCQEDDTEIRNNLQDRETNSDSDDSQSISIRDIAKKKLSVRNDSSESESEINNKQVKSIESTDDEDESSERMDNDAEINGFMFHKTLPVKKKVPSSRTIDKSNKDQIEEKVEDQVKDKDDTSSYESDSNTSEVSSGEQTLSPLTPKSNPSDSLSTISNESQSKKSEKNQKTQNEEADDTILPLDNKFQKSENSEEAEITNKPETNNEKNHSSPFIGK